MSFVSLATNIARSLVSRPVPNKDLGPATLRLSDGRQIRLKACQPVTIRTGLKTWTFHFRISESAPLDLTQAIEHLTTVMTKLTSSPFASYLTVGKNISLWFSGPGDIVTTREKTTNGEAFPNLNPSEVDPNKNWQQQTQLIIVKTDYLQSHQVQTFEALLGHELLHLFHLLIYETPKDMAFEEGIDDYLCSLAGLHNVSGYHPLMMAIEKLSKIIGQEPFYQIFFRGNYTLLKEKIKPLGRGKYKELLFLMSDFIELLNGKFYKDMPVFAQTLASFPSYAPNRPRICYWDDDNPNGTALGSQQINGLFGQIEWCRRFAEQGGSLISNVKDATLKKIIKNISHPQKCSFSRFWDLWTTGLLTMTYNRSHNVLIIADLGNGQAKVILRRIRKEDPIHPVIGRFADDIFLCLVETN